MGVLAVAGAVTSIIGQNQQRQDQKGYRNKLVQANQAQMDENRSIATTAYLDQAAQANNNLAQERIGAAESGQDQTTKRLQAQGAVNAAGAEAGAGGTALSSLMDDFHRQESMFRSHNDQNLLFKQQQTATSIRGEQGQATSRIAQIKPYQPSPIAPADYIGPALQAVGTGVGGYNNKQVAQKRATQQPF